MIHLDNTTDAQTVFLPFTGLETPGAPALLYFRDTLSPEADVVSVNIEALAVDGIHVSAPCRLPDGVRSGSYKWFLRQAQGLVSMGLAEIGTRQPSPAGKPYTNQKLIIKQS